MRRSAQQSMRCFAIASPQCRLALPPESARPATHPPPPHPTPHAHIPQPAAPSHHYRGLTVVELGSGPGLAGLLAARLGARVVITDKAVVCPLIAENIALNGLSHTPTAGCSGTAEVLAASAGWPSHARDTCFQVQTAQHCHC
jgi:hypothetical protein